MKDEFKKIIYEWVKENYGESEAEDPSWNIDALAEHLKRSNIDPNELSTYTQHQVYTMMDQHFVEEDVRSYAEDCGIDLEPHQVYTIADEIRNSGRYQVIDREDMQYYIHRELGRLL